MLKSISLAFLFASAQIVAAELSGNGIIYLLPRTGSGLADPNNKVGCLNTKGKAIKYNDPLVDCAVHTFKAVNSGTNTFYTSAGRCTFFDPNQPKNTDSKYGALDSAWSCGTVSGENTQDYFFTYDSGPNYIVYGENDYSVDAKKLPQGNDQVNMWMYRWGSQQMGITPGHVELQWLWEPVE